MGWFIVLLIVFFPGLLLAAHAWIRGRPWYVWLGWFVLAGMWPVLAMVAGIHGIDRPALGRPDLCGNPAHRRDSPTLAKLACAQRRRTATVECKAGRRRDPRCRSRRASRV